MCPSASWRTRPPQVCSEDDAIVDYIAGGQATSKLVLFLQVIYFRDCELFQEILFNFKNQLSQVYYLNF